jgi:hypothetical protein
MLPGEQEAQEVARGHRFDLGPEPLDRIMVNARQETALAPFVLGRPGRETAAHGKTFGFEACERDCDLAGLQAQGRTQCRRRDRAQAPQAARE